MRLKIYIMSEKNLYDEEAKRKLRELAEGIDFAMMETNLGGRPSHINPMSTKEVDDQGCLWFLSNKNSEHNSHLQKDDTIQLIYSKPSDMEFLIIFGKAEILTQRPILERYYGKMDDAWFDGVDDPNLTAIKVVPSEAQYWDTKNTKLVTMFKMGIGMLTGNQQDVGEQGNLEVN